MKEDVINIGFEISTTEFEKILKLYEKISLESNVVVLANHEKAELMVLLSRLKTLVKTESSTISTLSNNFIKLLETYHV